MKQALHVPTTFLSFMIAVHTHSEIAQELEQGEMYFSEYGDMYVTARQLSTISQKWQWHDFKV
jgi:hypothetical protein